MSTDARPTNPCPSCGATELLTIGFGDEGHQVVFRVCPPCESKWWERDGRSMDLATALPLLVG